MSSDLQGNFAYHLNNQDKGGIAYTIWDQCIVVDHKGGQSHEQEAEEVS